MVFYARSSPVRELMITLWLRLKALNQLLDQPLSALHVRGERARVVELVDSPRQRAFLVAFASVGPV
jgi:hypothetical protein